MQVPIQGEPFLELNDLVNQNDGNVGGVDLDLNQPLDDELGGIEDLIQVADAMEEEMAQVQEEQIILEDDQSDNSEGNLADHPLLNLNNDIKVNVFIPMDGDVPLHLMKSMRMNYLGTPSQIQTSLRLMLLTMATCNWAL